MFSAWKQLGKAYIKCSFCGYTKKIPFDLKQIDKQECYRPDYCESCGSYMRAKTIIFKKYEPEKAALRHEGFEKGYEEAEKIYKEKVREAYDKGMKQGIRYTYDKAKEKSIRTIERFIKDYKDGAYGVMQGVREKPLSTDEILELLLKDVKDN
jgi:hypothetical protein